MEKEPEIKTRSVYVVILQGAAILLLLWATSFYSYIFYHTLTELVTIVVAFVIFVIAWNSRRIRENNFILILGIAYFFVGNLDLLHTLSYQGLALFHNNNNLPTQLWIAARYLESLSFLVAFYFLRRKEKLSGDVVFLAYLIITSLTVLSIFWWKNFPVAFIDGSGLTPFKKISEYVISGIFLWALALLWKNRAEFDRRVLQFMLMALAVKIIAELLFTEYASVYGLSNFVGHLMKFFSFFLMYKAVAEIGITTPYNLLFLNLKRSEENYRNLVDNSLVGVYRADLAGNYLYVNDAMATIFGFENQKEMIAAGAKDRYDSAEDREAFLEELWEKGRLTHYELVGKKKNGEYINILSSTIRSGDEISGVVIDITKRKKAEKEAERLASFPQLNPNPVLEVSYAGEITFCNAAARKILGKNARSEDFKAFLPPDIGQILAEKEKKNFYREMRVGKNIFAEYLQTLPQLNVARIYTINITEKKQQEQEIKRQLSEKETLLKELHHRVKNNLQVISSLLNLQLKSAGDEKIAEALKLAQNRIKSIALVHEKFYRTKDFGSIDFKAYIKDLADKLFASYNIDRQIVGFRTELEDVRLKIELAVPCGMIISELLSNSLKHAFPGQKEGEIVISMREKGANEIELSVSDNGVGFALERQTQRKSSIGLDLVETIVTSQLNGNMEVQNNGGTTVVITFEKQ